MNKQILLTLSLDELETRIRDITNELNQEWHLDRRMRLSTGKRLQKELAILSKSFCTIQLIKEKTMYKIDVKLNNKWLEGMMQYPDDKLEECLEKVIRLKREGHKIRFRVVGEKIQ